jgi:hypothetical protein
MPEVSATAKMPYDRTHKVMRETSETVRDAARQLKQALEARERPGRSLDVVRQMTREAPLPALVTAFLLGVVIAKR